MEGIGQWSGGEMVSYGYYKNGLKEGIWRIKNIRNNEVFYECVHVNDVQHGRTWRYEHSSVKEYTFIFSDSGLWSGEEVVVYYDLEDDPNPGSNFSE